ncbi:MAG: hypothetical protein ACFNYI_01300 [Eubacterium sp.]
MNPFKLHKCSAIVMIIAAIVCVWSGHKMTSPSAEAETESEEHDD